MTLPIYRGREQHGKGWEVGDKGMGNWRAGYGRQEVLTPCPSHLEFITFCYQVVVGGGGGGRSKVEGPLYLYVVLTLTLHMYQFKNEICGQQKLHKKVHFADCYINVIVNLCFNSNSCLGKTYYVNLCVCGMGYQ